MRCPVCKIDMIVVEYRGIELDHCLECRGVWFDAGELDLLMKAAGINEALTFPADEAEVREKKRKCPICSKAMKKTHIGAPEQVLVDVCSLGDGIWFDGGELGQVIDQLAGKTGDVSDAQQEIVRFVSEVFKAEK